MYTCASGNLENGISDSKRKEVRIFLTFELNTHYNNNIFLYRNCSKCFQRHTLTKVNEEFVRFYLYPKFCMNAGLETN